MTKAKRKAWSRETDLEIDFKPEERGAPLMAPAGRQVFDVGAASAGERLDRFLGRAAAQRRVALSRTRLKALIEAGEIRIDGAVARDPSLRLGEGATIAFEAPAPEESPLVGEDIPLDVVYEDDNLIVIDKPAGLVVHPAPGHVRGTLVNALIGHCGASLSGVGGVRRPGIVHRLDKDTSGLMVVAKTDASPISSPITAAVDLWSANIRRSSGAASTRRPARWMRQSPVIRTSGRRWRPHPRIAAGTPSPTGGSRSRSVRRASSPAGLKPGEPTRSACTWPQ
jgi:RNA pseudouridylate synthase/S4 domain